MRGKAGKTGGDCATGPRGTFQFSGLPEGLAKLRRVVTLLAYVHKQRLQIKISKGIKCTEQSPGENFQLPSPSGGLGTVLYSPSTSVCHEVYCQAGKLTQALLSMVFVGAVT